MRFCQRGVLFHKNTAINFIRFLKSFLHNSFLAAHPPASLPGFAHSSYNPYPCDRMEPNITHDTEVVEELVTRTGVETLSFECMSWSHEAWAVFCRSCWPPPGTSLTVKGKRDVNHSFLGLCHTISEVQCWLGLGSRSKMRFVTI